MSVIAAYDMYIECCEGGLDSEWFVEAKDRMTFRDFRLLLSEQMMTYDPRAQLYHGDENFRKVTRLGKRKKKGTVTYWKGEKGGVSLENYKIAKTSSRHSPSRLCGPLDDFEKHIASVTRKTHYNNCAACGKRTAWKCGLCKKYMCVGKGGGAVKLHSTMI